MHSMLLYTVMAGTLLGMGKDNAREVSHQYFAHGSVLVNETPRGRASPDYVLDDARKLKPKHLARIESYIATCHGEKGGGWVTIDNIRNDVNRSDADERQ